MEILESDNNNKLALDLTSNNLEICSAEHRNLIDHLIQDIRNENSLITLKNIIIEENGNENIINHLVNSNILSFFDNFNVETPTTNSILDFVTVFVEYVAKDDIISILPINKFEKILEGYINGSDIESKPFYSGCILAILNKNDEYIKTFGNHVHKFIDIIHMTHWEELSFFAASLLLLNTLKLLNFYFNSGGELIAKEDISVIASKCMSLFKINEPSFFNYILDFYTMLAKLNAEYIYKELKGGNEGIICRLYCIFLNVRNSLFNDSVISFLRFLHCMLDFEKSMSHQIEEYLLHSGSPPLLDIMIYIIYIILKDFQWNQLVPKIEQTLIVLNDIIEYQSSHKCLFHIELNKEDPFFSFITSGLECIDLIPSIYYWTYISNDFQFKMILSNILFKLLDKGNHEIATLVLKLDGSLLFLISILESGGNNNSNIIRSLLVLFGVLNEIGWEYVDKESIYRELNQPYLDSLREEFATPELVQGIDAIRNILYG